MIIHSMLLVRNSQPFTKYKTDNLTYLHLKDLTQQGKSSKVFLPGNFLEGFANDEKWIGTEAELSTSPKPPSIC